MRSIWRTLAVSTAVLAFVVQVAHAEDVQNEMQEMRDMVLQLQDQVNAQQQTIEAQNIVLEESGLSDQARGESSGLSAFLEQTEFSGWVASSYTFNTNSDGNNALVGQNSATVPFVTPLHPDSNTFAVDQVWFSMDKDVSSKSRAGFHVDLLFGAHADFLNGTGLAGNDGVEIFTAYASYLAPIGSGVRIDVGELPTLIGAEVVQANANFNITRGLSWGIQPVTHTGVMLSTDVGPLAVSVGALNDGLTDSSADTDNGKAVTGSVGIETDMVNATASVIWGSPTIPVGRDSDDVGEVDLVLTADPMDNLSVWYDFTYLFADNDNTVLGNINIWSNAIAARLGLTDDLGVAVRGEYLAINDLPDIWALTGTVDYALAQGLTGRFEVRYDDTDAGDVFLESSGTSAENQQILLLAELLYEF